MERETLGQTQNSGRHRSVDMFFKFLWQKVMEFRGIKHDPSDPMDPTPGFLFRSAIPPAVVVKSKVSSCRTCLVIRCIFQGRSHAEIPEKYETFQVAVGIGASTGMSAWGTERNLCKIIQGAPRHDRYKSGEITSLIRVITPVTH